MIIVSHNVLFKTDLKLPPHAIMRVNTAWQKSKREVAAVLKKLPHDVYLDYPQGRTKPPKPSITLKEALELAHKFENVKYFAVSNVEEPEAIFQIRVKLPKRVQLVPKIETKKGVENLGAVIRKIGATHIMLDKEDLYLDVDRDSALYEKLIKATRKTCRAAGVNCLELQGVVFSHPKR